MNVAVIGAGVVGLSTALSIQEVFPSFKISIFADKFNEETLSSGAGGIFRPEINVHPDSDRVRKWCLDSLSHFTSILNSREASDAGMELVSGYQLSSTSSHPQNQFLQDLLTQYQVLDEEEIASKSFPEKFRKGVFFTTIVTDCRYYLPWMKSKFEKAGGEIKRKTLTSLDDIPRHYDIVVNCSGLGAQHLISDDQLVAVRGQTIRVKAPWIKHFYYGDAVYILPGVDYVTLGGIKDYGSYDLEVNNYQRQWILDKCVELVPSLKNAEIVRDWVGLRPHRPSVRVDACFVPSDKNYRMVVNNYGHGGHGVALSWGTAQDVTRIIKKLLSTKDFVASKL
ncbi:D-aspartate oxidase [Parasteatoda tepidariorum]|uniref:D-aspartate oxidase n=1 Tax=Parasteatoda tepidariorum TaxID=114398 RepID=UPI00077FC4A8|nr:D-aspartate oxidase [Parasteatoda tepidariorum]